MKKYLKAPKSKKKCGYNPLIPDGDNWKATFMIEYPDPVERAEKLNKLVG